MPDVSEARRGEDRGAGPWFPGHHAATDPDRPAVIDAASGATRTFHHVDAYANRTSRLLRRLGLGVGDHVALWLDNSVDYPALWWGARYAGLHYTLVSTRLTPAEAAYIVADSGSKVLVLGPRLSAEHGSVVRPLLGPGVRVIRVGSGPGELDALLALEEPEPLAERIDGAPMLYSSGTTGAPKAVERALTGAGLGQSKAAAGMALRFGIDDAATYLSPAPLYHAAPCGFVSGTLAVGGTAVVMDHFDAEGFLAAVERYGVTHAQLVPTMFVRLLALPADVKSRYRLDTLQCVVHAGAPCPVPVKEQMLDWWGTIIYEYYSGTENVGFTLCSPVEWRAHPGSVGRPVGCEIHVVGPDVGELPAGETGAVYFSGSGGFAYHNDAAKTRDSYLANGWATFGDIGHVDADGYLYLTDRQANMIIVGGVNVYPQEAENLLLSDPRGADVAVFGIPHDEFGEEVKAVVQPEPGIVADAALETELLVLCRHHLAGVKCPRSIDFAADLPREPTGKLLKRIVRDQYRAALTSRAPQPTRETPS